MARICSRISTDKCYVRFINESPVKIQLVWVNFQGAYQHYRFLNEKEFVEVQTYKTHPWMALNVKTKDKMLLNGQFFFEAPSLREYLLEAYPRRPELINGRVPVRIVVPIHSLKYLALLLIKNHVKNVEDVQRFGIPLHLQEDLRKEILLREQVIQELALGPQSV